MSDIWSRTWCEIQQTPNTALRGTASSADINDSSNYVPRTSNDPTNPDAVHNRSPSSSPERQTLLCFQFGRREGKKSSNSHVIQKSKHVLEEAPYFKAPKSESTHQDAGAITPPTSPNKVRLERRVSLSSSTSSFGEDEIGGITELPDVVNIKRKVTADIQSTSRNYMIPTKDIDRENISRIQELRNENERLRALTERSKSTKSSLYRKDTSGKTKINPKDEDVQHLKPSQGESSLRQMLSCIENTESPQEVKTTAKLDGRFSRRGSEGVYIKTNEKTCEINMIDPNKTSSKSGHSKSNVKRRGSSKYTSHSQDHGHGHGYVFIGSSGQVVAECKGVGTQVIVRNVRSSVYDCPKGEEETDEEFDVKKIQAVQLLKEISMRMEKEKNNDS